MARYCNLLLSRATLIFCRRSRHAIWSGESIRDKLLEVLLKTDREQLLVIHEDKKHILQVAVEGDMTKEIATDMLIRCSCSLMRW